jgi:hypothetical protein
VKRKMSWIIQVLFVGFNCVFWRIRFFNLQCLDFD